MSLIAEENYWSFFGFLSGFCPEKLSESESELVFENKIVRSWSRSRSSLGWNYRDRSRVSELKTSSPRGSSRGPPNVNDQDLHSDTERVHHSFSRTQVNGDDIGFHTRFGHLDLRIQSTMITLTYRLASIDWSRIRISSLGIWSRKQVSIVIVAIEHPWRKWSSCKVKRFSSSGSDRLPVSSFHSAFD